MASFPSDLLSSLHRAGVPQGGFIAAKKKTAPQMINADLRKRLSDSFSSSVCQKWGVPQVSDPLSQEEINFLQRVTVDELMGSGRRANKSNLILEFCLDIFKSVVTNAITTSLAESEITSYRSEAPKSVLARYPASQEEVKVDNEISLPIEEIEVRLSRGGKDPSVEKMNEIASSDISRTVRSSLQKEIRDWINSASVRPEMAAVNEAFIKHAGQVISSAAASGVFVSKVEEIGWKGASAELAQKVVLGFISKYSANGMTALMGCSNPVICAKVITTVISDVFVPTETAPPDQDMMRSLPLPLIENVVKSRLPRLDPPYPSLRLP